MSKSLLDHLTEPEIFDAEDLSMTDYEFRYHFGTTLHGVEYLADLSEQHIAEVQASLRGDEGDG